jgi:uncharacterized OB-fold protein
MSTYERPPSRPLPEITADNADFWTGGGDGTLKVRRCGDCGYYIHPPWPRCPRCLSTNVAAAAVSGRGKVDSFTVNYHPWLPGFPPPYIMALVGLDEQAGLRIATNIINVDPADVSIGMAVMVTFERWGDVYLPLFQPVSRA